MVNTDLVIIGGSRPEIIKLSELVKSLKEINSVFLYTGQHYSSNMKDVFLEELGILPDCDLGCATSDVFPLKQAILRFLRDMRPGFVAVYGDTNSTYAGALAAKEIGDCNLIHLEAGLRSFDRTSTEEKNRTLVDSMSDILFAPSNLCKTFLSYERSTADVHVTGNLIVDICRKFSNHMNSRPPYVPDEYLLLTFHRAENVDDPYILSKFIKRLSEIPYDIIFPIHPRTLKNLKLYTIKVPRNVHIIEPVSYIEFLSLMKSSRLVLTDSGGVQEEAVVLGKPCITLRTTTERWETILIKANTLFPIYGSQSGSLNGVVDEMLMDRKFSNPYGDNVTNKTKKILMDYLKDIRVPKFQNFLTNR